MPRTIEGHAAGLTLRADSCTECAECLRQSRQVVRLVLRDDVQVARYAYVAVQDGCHSPVSTKSTPSRTSAARRPWGSKSPRAMAAVPGALHGCAAAKGEAPSACRIREPLSRGPPECALEQGFGPGIAKSDPELETRCTGQALNRAVEGTRNPDSILPTVDCGTPARRASSACVSPALLRASRISASKTRL
jgi:hypothetical protein